MKIEITIRIRPLNAIIRASAARPLPERPRVSDRKIGVFPIGLTIGNSAPTTSRVFLTRSLSGPSISPHSDAAQGIWRPNRPTPAQPEANRRDRLPAARRGPQKSHMHGIECHSRKVARRLLAFG